MATKFMYKMAIIPANLPDLLDGSNAKPGISFDTDTNPTEVRVNVGNIERSTIESLLAMGVTKLDQASYDAEGANFPHTTGIS